MIDTHCHLADDVYVADLHDVSVRARAAGVDGALCILSADEPAEIERVQTVSAAWPGIVFAAGIHPHRTGAFGRRPDAAMQVTRAAVAAAGAAAIGEIGLDYHYDHAPRDAQRETFAAQLAVARELALPVAIHTRAAFDDTLAVLREAGGGLRAVIHCFSEGPDEARRALDLGYYLSISGIVTFPKAGGLREVAAFVPADRLLAETDAPFLAPVPLRGKRNEPAWVQHTAAAIAAARGMTPAAVGALVSENFQRFIGRAA